MLKSEEEGSDVDLASHLLHDSFRNLYDTIVIVSSIRRLVDILVDMVQFGSKTGYLSAT